MNVPASLLVSVLGAIAIIGVLRNMTPGFGPTNLKVLTVVLVATLATLLVVLEPAALTTGLTLLGTLAGYAFGVSAKAGASDD